MTIEEKVAAYEEMLKKSTMRRRLSDIDLFISWGQFAREYFGHSASWFYHKLNGIDGNGGSGGFTPEEMQEFKGALCDLADRLRSTADKL